MKKLCDRICAMKRSSVFACLLFSFTTLSAQQTNISGPVGSGQFSLLGTVLNNGNYVIIDPYYDDGAVADVGAVYLYDGSNHQLISMLKGSTAGDNVGLQGVTGLPDGNFIIRSSNWNNGNITHAGAITWGNGVTGVSGLVNSSNSLIGSTANDQVGNGGITVLTNGNCVVRSSLWDNGTAIDAGAITWISASLGISGVLNSSNSLVGSASNDNIGDLTMITLSNGNYVVRSSLWNNGSIADAGAVTWCNGSSGTSGAISSNNSVVGSTAGDNVGGGSCTPNTNGNFLFTSPNWDNGSFSNAGAATWVDGTTGKTGVLSSSNSIVGSATNSSVGSAGITLLPSGNFVVNSSGWDNGAVANVGAITWINGATGITGTISSSNSLIGSTTGDAIGNRGIITLSNGNYIVMSRNWDNGAVVDAGAVTWCNGTTGRTGTVSSANSLVGASSDLAGNSGIVELANGNYLVRTHNWRNGAVIDAGAVTWGNGATGISGVISTSNSLVGSSQSDLVGFDDIDILPNGNYVVRTSAWDNGGVLDAGAATWCNGTTGRTGVVSSSNSVVGSTASDRVGTSVTVLNNGNYVLGTPNWDNGAVVNVGAATWCNGTTGRVGVINSSNSLIGATADDRVGTAISALTNGKYVVQSINWDNGAITNAGAVTLCDGTTGLTGLVNTANSLVGTTANDNVGNIVNPLPNGNFVIRSPNWNNGAATTAGAVTFVNGSTGLTGPILNTNSLVGGNAGDNIGNFDFTILPSGNFVFRSPGWDNGAVINAGAVTWGSATTGVTGILNSSNSLTGAAASDNPGSAGMSILGNGNYIIRSPLWNNGSKADAGAVTWASGTASITGQISFDNSIVGTNASDNIGDVAPVKVSSNKYFIRSGNWDKGNITNSGAITWINGDQMTSGIVTSCNSVIGAFPLEGSYLYGIYNQVYDYLLVGKPLENMFTIYDYTVVSTSLAVSQDDVMTNIPGTQNYPLIANGGCRIIGSLRPNGATPVSGTINAKVWIEPSVPTYAGQPFVARHYEITPTTNPTTSTGKVTLYFTQQEFDDFNAHTASAFDLPTNNADVAGKANLRIGKYSGTSSDGSGLPATYSGTKTVIDPVDDDIVWNSTLSRWEIGFDVTGFSGFIVQTSSVVLPLTLLEFNGRLINNNALLNWKTENEINTDKFIIERSIDNRTYSAIGNVSALNRAGINHYSFTDPNINSLGAAVVYYRLKQMDIDGHYVYSNIIALSIDKNLVLLYPNPARDLLNLTIATNKSDQLQLRIIDNTGRVVQQKQLTVPSGSTSLNVDISSLATGIYYLELKGETLSERKQFVRQ